jgi:arylsulfate sulfotransferase
MRRGLLLFLFIFLVSYNTTNAQAVFKVDSVELNPHKYAPLTALVYAHSKKDGTVSIKVKGKHGPASDITHHFEERTTQHKIEIMGLYPDYYNTVEIAFHNKLGFVKAKTVVNIRTKRIDEDLLTIKIDTAQYDKMEPGLTLVNNTSSSVSSIPFMIDAFGDIRWFLFFGESEIGEEIIPGHIELNQLFYAIGLFRSKNGNFYFGDKTTDFVYEVSLMGEIIDSCSMHGYEYHHDMYEKPNGNYLIPVSAFGRRHKPGRITEEDHVIEIDRKSKELIRVWDLKEALGENRCVIDIDIQKERPFDWVHVNSITYDDRDSTIIISGRYQTAVIKLTQDNKVKWILGPHKDWGKSKSGVDLNKYLLQPLDSEGKIISDTAVLNGSKNHPDFEWNWMQHAVELLPNNHIILFDNGRFRNFSNEEKYSRGVEYKIDEDNMTVQQIWSYGKERGPEFYSIKVSDIDFVNNNVLICSSHRELEPGKLSGKIVEVDYKTKEVIFEATLYSPLSIAAFHQVERIKLYPTTLKK